MSVKVGIIGTGNMGGAIIKGLCSSKRAYEIYAYDINTGLTEQFKRQYSITVMPSIQELTKECDIVIAAVKPQCMESILEECEKTLSRSTLFVSVAVGLPIAYYSGKLGKDKNSQNNAQYTCACA